MLMKIWFPLLTGTAIILYCVTFIMHIYVITHADLCQSVGVGRIFESVCLSVCPQHNSKTNDPNVFKLDIGIFLSWKVKGQG